MPQIVGRVARIPVAEAKDGERIQPDHVYFAPPGKEVCVYDGAIQLIERSDSSPTLTIDPFLRSLAADAGKKAAAVILSGTGGDGSGGVKEVKANDGLVLVQSRDTAEYAGMPNSAVATGVVDMEMKPGAMPAVLVQHFSTERAIATQSIDEQAEQSGKWLPKVFAVIRSQVGHDFAGYKRSTLLRRIHRRMALHRIEDPQEYVDLLHKDRSEVETLFHEFLIGVTHFFRDSESFDALRDQALPSLLEEFEQGSTLRVWVAGCSTGEEAYSVAMVIHEALDRMPEKRITFQIFATDIDSWAIQKARGAAEAVLRERERQLPCAKGDQRERDLLRPGRTQGPTVLAPAPALLSESAHLPRTSAAGPSLAALDAQTKLYRRNEVPDSVRGRVDFPTNSTGTSQGPEPAPSQPAKRKENLGELTREALLSNFGPTGVLIDQEGTIIHVQGRTGTYLEHTTGPATHNILDMAREGLRLELSAAIRSARASSEPVTHRGVTVQTNGETERIDVSVKRLSAPAERAGRPADRGGGGTTGGGTRQPNPAVGAGAQ